MIIMTVKLQLNELSLLNIQTDRQTDRQTDHRITV